MKTIKIILLLFLVVPFSASGQLKGEFCMSTGFTRECIIFLDSNKFEYSSSSCTYSHKGKGFYTKTFRYLTLNFEFETKDNQKHTVVNSKDTNANKIKINIETQDVEGNKLPYTIIEFKDSIISI